MSRASRRGRLKWSEDETLGRMIEQNSDIENNRDTRLLRHQNARVPLVLPLRSIVRGEVLKLWP